MRTKVDWRSASRASYASFRKKHPSIELTYVQWSSLIYMFNESFRDYILETGERAKFPYGFGEFSIKKKKRKHIKKAGDREFINLPVDWKKTKELGKIVYNFNYHTDGYFFGWTWFKDTVRFKNSDLWYFKPTRTTSKMLFHYLTLDNKYQHLYQEW